MTNSPNGQTIDLLRDMEVFDLLPPSIQEQLRAAPLNYSAEQVLRAWMQTDLTDQQFVRLVMIPKFQNDVRNIQQ